MIAFVIKKMITKVIILAALRRSIFGISSGSEQNPRRGDEPQKKLSCGIRIKKAPEKRMPAGKKEKIMLKVSVRENKIENAKAKFVFHSENNGEVSYDNLVKQMASHNTTITEADIYAVFNVFKDVAVENLADGKTVCTPLGRIYAIASGTTDNPLASFDASWKTEGQGLRLRFKPDTKVYKSLLENTKIERTSSRLKMVPYIQDVSSINGESKMSVSRGKPIRLSGEYMKIDTSDKSQGIFLVKDGVETRLDYYIWNKDKRIDVLIPQTVEAGSYNVKIAAKPNTILYTDTFTKPLTVA